MTRALTILLAAALLASCLFGCTPQDRPYVPTGDGLYDDSTTTPSTAPSGTEQQFSLAYYADQGLNPYEVSGHTNRAMFGLLYQGLFSVDRNYQTVPILCKSYTVSKDMKTYVFYPEAATFSDGSTLTAQDVAASLLKAKGSTVYKGRLGAVSSVTVQEDGGVAVKLSTPYENLPLLLDIPIVKEGDVDGQFPVGTGAYSFQASLNGYGLLRRQDWWCGGDLQVTASFIPLVEATSTHDVRDAFEFGDVGVVCADPGSDTYVDYRSDHEVWECENGIFLYLGCNEESAVFSNQEVRQALTYAIDRNLLVESYYRGFAVAATLPASPNSPYYNTGLAAKYSYDAVLFLQALEEAQLVGSEVTLLVNKGDSRRVRASRAIVQMLNDCGLKVRAQELSGSAYTSALRKGEYDLHLGQTILSPNMDLSAFYDTAGALNYGGMSDAAILALCKEAMANSGNYYTLHKAVMDDGTLCPILFRSYAVYATRGLLSNIQPARDQIFFYSIGKTMADVLQTA